MKDIDISKRFLERRSVEKSFQEHIFERLDKSLSIDKNPTIDRSYQKIPVSYTHFVHIGVYRLKQ